MNDLFYEYMSKRMNDINLNDSKIHKGPVVTISRAAGCTSRNIVDKLSSILNEISGEEKWEVISKEILHHSAEEMKLHPDKIKAIFEPKSRNILDEIVQTFISEDYQLEKKMIKTVTNVIHRFGVEGYKIIIGRAANYICSDIEKALHVRIDAPLNWRIDKVMKNKDLTKEEALNYINITEKNRANYRKSIKGKKSLCDDFDLIINQASFSQENITDIIMNALKMKNII